MVNEQKHCETQTEYFGIDVQNLNLIFTYLVFRWKKPSWGYLHTSVKQSNGVCKVFNPHWTSVETTAQALSLWEMKIMIRQNTQRVDVKTLINLQEDQKKNEKWVKIQSFSHQQKNLIRVNFFTRKKAVHKPLVRLIVYLNRALIAKWKWKEGKRWIFFFGKVKM